jgi:hypothetical protein
MLGSGPGWGWGRINGVRVTTAGTDMTRPPTLTATMATEVAVGDGRMNEGTVLLWRRCQDHAGPRQDCEDRGTDEDVSRAARAAVRTCAGEGFTSPAKARGAFRCASYSAPAPRGGDGFAPRRAGPASERQLNRSGRSRRGSMSIS